jgi:hypothetical protein
MIFATFICFLIVKSQPIQNLANHIDLPSSFSWTSSASFRHSRRICHSGRAFRCSKRSGRRHLKFHRQERWPAAFWLAGRIHLKLHRASGREKMRWWRSRRLLSHNDKRRPASSIALEKMLRWSSRRLLGLRSGHCLGRQTCCGDLNHDAQQQKRT